MMPNTDADEPFFNDARSTAPRRGVAAERRQAIDFARQVLANPPAYRNEVALLARMYLRECGIS
jgi:hypothetical protein